MPIEYKPLIDDCDIWDIPAKEQLTQRRLEELKLSNRKIMRLGKTKGAKLDPVENKNARETFQPVRKVTIEEIIQWKKWKIEGTSYAEISRRSGKSVF